MRPLGFTPLLALLLPGALAPNAAPAAPQTDKPVAQNAAKPVAQKAGQSAAQEPFKATPRVRPRATVRLGGVYTLGLSSPDQPLEESAALGKPLSAENAHWIADNCDVVALNAVNITPQTFPAMTAAWPLFTPLLYTYVSTLYEQPAHRGNVGGWNPQMANLTLRDDQDREVPHPDQGGHWMDFGSVDWAAHWRDRVIEQVRQYGALGVVAAELPINNTFVNGKLKKYSTEGDRADATETWLRAARAAGRYQMIPNALGFDTIAPHGAPPSTVTAEEPELRGRLWDDFLPLTDGAWAEGWVRPYWTDAPVNEDEWERQLEAADRAGRLGQIFIAAAAYHNADELEYALASYFLVVHGQGRVVFQPMPLVDGQRNDAGFSLAVLQHEVQTRSRYFNAALGYPLQERHLVPAEGGNVWKRAFEFGIVYVNSNDTLTITIPQAGTLKRLDGTRIRTVALPPHSGVTLVYR
jgi:hypothetical protein